MKQYYISLLRGINVSGQKMIKMAALKAMYEGLGFESVVTYIQSGNVVFKSEEPSLSKLKSTIESGIKITFGFDVVVAVITHETLKLTIKNDPFLLEDIAFRYVTFLSTPIVSENVGQLSEIVLDKMSDEDNVLDEKFIISENAIYLCCPNGYGRTKFSNTFFEKKLNQPCTTRNWKTVLALSRLIS